MAVLLADYFQWLENTAWAVTIRQSPWLYPALEVIHILGIVLLSGGAILFDLRLLGFGKELPANALASHLLLWSWRGLYLVVPSGLLLFITGATEFGFNPTFWLKMILLVLAGLNALAFHKYIFPAVVARNTHRPALAQAKTAAVFSILFWVSVIICGRWLAY